MLKFLLVALGGAIGSSARYSISLLIHSRVQPGFPWGTFAVNITGCLLMGILWKSVFETLTHENLRLFVLIGILGGFTTFSSFGLETLRLLQAGAARTALLYVLSTNLLGFGAVYAGYTATELIFKNIR